VKGGRGVSRGGGKRGEEGSPLNTRNPFSLIREEGRGYQKGEKKHSLPSLLVPAIERRRKSLSRRKREGDHVEGKVVSSLLIFQRERGGEEKKGKRTL